MFDETEASREAADDAGIVDSLEVEIRFCIGRATLTLLQVRQLVAGSLIDLAASPDVRVDILVNDRQIGRGDLVEIDGQLAVQIVELAGTRE